MLGTGLAGSDPLLVKMFLERNGIVNVFEGTCHQSLKQTVLVSCFSTAFQDTKGKESVGSWQLIGRTTGENESKRGPYEGIPLEAEE